MTNINSDSNSLYYIADPMCSWCWGFAPELDKILKQVNNTQPAFGFHIILGGLRPGALAKPLDKKLKHMLKHHWQEVSEKTKQPFSFDFLEKENFNYDTEPAAKAVVVMKNLAKVHEYEYFKDIQNAFYHQGLDPTDTNVLANLALKYGITQTDFNTTFNSKDIKEETWGNFKLASTMGINGFPSLVVKINGELVLLTKGYQKADSIIDHFKAIIANKNQDRKS